ncbi:hypothetical protein Tco_1109287 [Tanacetum coccineum]
MMTFEDTKFTGIGVNMFGRVSFHMGRQNLQTTIETHDDVDGIFYQNLPNRGRREQFSSKYKLTPFMEQPPTTILPSERVNKTKNKGKKANLSPLNLGCAFEDDNVEENNVTFLGSQFTGNFLMYENVEPSKVRRGNYVNLLAFLNDPHQVYLDCYMKGYIVPERITKKRTKNKAKTTKPDSEWKRL